MSSKDKVIKKTVSVNGQDLILEIGQFAEFADAAVLARYGDTVVHVAVVTGEPKPELGYFPLSVEYQEKLYAGGIIKGSRWVKREGRPSDDIILKARLIDRSIRPLFADNYFNEVQVIVTVLSYDQQNEADMPALCATSAALSISGIPFKGPIAGVRVGMDDKQQFIINPTKDQQQKSLLDLVVSGTQKAVVMVEAGAQEVNEDQTIKALKAGHQSIQKIIKIIDQLVLEVKPLKQAVSQVKIDQDLQKKVLSHTKTSIDDLVKKLPKGASSKQIQSIKSACHQELENEDQKTIDSLIDDYFFQVLRQNLTQKKIRPDGRKLDQIRPLTSKVNLLPRTHGSGLFQRGSTQVLTITTLGSPSMEQLIESIEGQEAKRYIHHYSSPPYSFGEPGRLGWPSRREIGHGALAERALLPVIPQEDQFPYTIHLVSEVMASNGSTSMAATCGSTLALMDAGVPIKKPVAGIAMGLVEDLILTDILGLEDHFGDMDFKVAGTKDGITALQMDIKIDGLSFDLLQKALDKARIARLEILENMTQTIDKPKQSVSAYAPQISVLHILPDKIGELIGPGGRTIRQIIKETECQIDVNDEGRVVVSGHDPQSLKKAVDSIDSLTREIEPDQEFDGQVVRVEPYGVFVEILPGRDGLVHISRLSTQRLDHPNQVTKLGETLHVRVVGIDDQNRISLSALTKDQEQQKHSPSQRRKRY